MRLRRQPDDHVRSHMSLGLNIALILGVAVVATAVLGAALWLVLGRPPIRQVGTWTAANSFEFAKIVLALVGGAGAVVALVIAYRKQRLGEVADQREDIKLFAERFTKAADQLGSDKAPVRLAGMYALEDLGQGTLSQRQTIVNVLCAYLRMPYQPAVPHDLVSSGDVSSNSQAPSRAQDASGAPDPTSVNQAENERRHQEVQVRLTTQRILASHLRPGDTPERPVGTFWKDIDLDLTGATLLDLDFNKCCIKTARFNKAQFVGPVKLSGARFDGDVWFSKAQFGGDAFFSDAQFSGAAWFGEAQFGWIAWFSKTQFGAEASFRGTQFGGPAWFSDAQFSGSAWFSDAQFSEVALFRDVRVRLDVQLGLDGRVWPNGMAEVEPATDEAARLLGQHGKWGFLRPSASDDSPEG